MVIPKLFAGSTKRHPQMIGDCSAFLFDMKPIDSEPEGIESEAKALEVIA